MPALIGKEREAAFADLDAIEDTFGDKLVAEVAAAVDAGQLPTAPPGPLAGHAASLGGQSPARDSCSADEIDISIFADTGFTASAIMSLLRGWSSAPPRTGVGRCPAQERSTRRPAAPPAGRPDHDVRGPDGWRQGRVDIIMSATDRITDAASGSFVALYTSRSTGHFDVDACPD